MNLIEKIEELGGFLTGSRAWGCERPDSDHDYVVRIAHENDLEIFCKENRLEMVLGGSMNMSSYCTQGDLRINLIFVPDSYWFPWKQATSWMQTLALKDEAFKKVLHYRPLRLDLFQKLRDAANRLDLIEKMEKGEL